MKRQQLGATTTSRRTGPSTQLRAQSHPLYYMIHSAEAPSNLVEAEAISRELGNTAHLSMNMSARGGVLYEMGRYKEAIQAYTKTIELSDGADVAAFRHACCNQIA